MHSLSRDTWLWKWVITIIKGNASASTQPLMNRCTLKNHTCTSIFCISILVIFAWLLLLKVSCYFLLFSRSYLAGFVVYDTLLWPKLNVNTFCTQLFIYSHFYLIFFLCFYLFRNMLLIHATHDGSVLVRDGESKRSIIFTEEIELGK